MAKSGITLCQWSPRFGPYSNQTRSVPYDNSGSPVNVLASAGTQHTLIDAAAGGGADEEDAALLVHAQAALEVLTGKRIVVVDKEQARAPPPLSPVPVQAVVEQRPVQQPVVAMVVEQAVAAPPRRQELAEMMVDEPHPPPQKEKRKGADEQRCLSALAKRIALPACMRVTEESLSAVPHAAAAQAGQHVQCSNCNTAVEASNAVAVATRLLHTRGDELCWKVFHDIACRRCSDSLRAEWAAANSK